MSSFHGSLRTPAVQSDRASSHIPILTGATEFTTSLGCRFAEDAKQVGVDDLILESLLLGATG